MRRLQQDFAERIVRAAETRRHQLSWRPVASIPGRLADSLADYPGRNSRRRLRTAADGRHRRWSSTGERAIQHRSTDTARSITDKVTAIFGRIVPDVVQQFARPAAGAACRNRKRALATGHAVVPADGEIDWRGLTVEAGRRPGSCARRSVSRCIRHAWRAKSIIRVCASVWSSNGRHRRALRRSDRRRHADLGARRRGRNPQRRNRRRSNAGYIRHPVAYGDTFRVV